MQVAHYALSTLSTVALVGGIVGESQQSQIRGRLRASISHPRQGVKPREIGQVFSRSALAPRTFRMKRSAGESLFLEK